MGQYYCATVLDEDFKVKAWLNPHDYDNGMKLMEHSYIGNNYVNAVLRMILETPLRVAWIGDYSKGDYAGDAHKDKIPNGGFQQIYDCVWDDDRQKYKARLRAKRLPFDKPKDFTGWKLVNHSRKAFVDLGKVNQKDEYGYIVHPLPLLTACGNGLGGGDYYHRYPDVDKCGLWAFDVIEFAQDVPDSYAEEAYSFCERRTD